MATLNIASIRWNQKKERYACPKQLTQQLLTVLEHGAPKHIAKALYNEERRLHKLIGEQWDTILEDTVFGYSAKLAEQHKLKFRVAEAYSILLALLADKLPSAEKIVGTIAVVKLNLACHKQAPYTVQYAGNEYSGIASGLSRFVGEFQCNGLTYKIFPKFVSKPFFQYGKYS